MKLVDEEHNYVKLSGRQRRMIALWIDAGGYGTCSVKTDSIETAVFASKDDAGYKAIHAMCVEGKNFLEKIKRFDMEGFRPPKPYIHEMKRYGVLPADLPDDAVIDIYETDQAYWRSLWYKPIIK